MEISSIKENYLKDEIWVLSLNASFQRNGIYKKQASSKDKQLFRNELKSYIQDTIVPRYKNKVEEDEHKKNLKLIIDSSIEYGSILKHGQLSIGAVQKLLNLTLKYYWCLGLIPEPPHFPIDRIIQKKLPPDSRKNWTEMSFEDYSSIIKAAKNNLKDGETLAQWELQNYQRGS